MPRRAREYVFEIDAYTPTTIPMNRLAEYMADLATLLGEHKSVHFVRLAEGSVNIVHAIEYEAEPKIRQRLRGIRGGDGPPDALKARYSINRRLEHDNASGVLQDPEGKKIIDFPGKKRQAQPEFGPFNQPGTIDGIPIRVGGENDPVPVHLQEEGQEPHICFASRLLARSIAAYIFTATIRVEGIGRWRRDADEKWIREKFTIQSFRILNRVPLVDAVAQLRSVSTDLSNINNPLEMIRKLRSGERLRK